MSERCTTSYTAKNYFKKCRELNLLPLKVRLDFFAILLFHQIIHKTVAIKLPVYITLAPETTLGYSHNDPLTFKSLIKPRIIKIIRKNPKLKKKVIKSKTRTVKTKKKVKTTKHRNKKRSKYFKHRTRENIYTDDKNITDDFGENKVLINSYFYLLII